MKIIHRMELAVLDCLDMLFLWLIFRGEEPRGEKTPNVN